MDIRNIRPLNHPVNYPSDAMFLCWQQEVEGHKVVGQSLKPFPREAAEAILQNLNREANGYDVSISNGHHPFLTKSFYKRSYCIHWKMVDVKTGIVQRGIIPIFFESRKDALRLIKDDSFYKRFPFADNVKVGHPEEQLFSEAFALYLRDGKHLSGPLMLFENQEKAEEMAQQYRNQPSYIHMEFRAAPESENPFLFETFKNDPDLGFKNAVSGLGELGDLLLKDDLKE